VGSSVVVEVFAFRTDYRGGLAYRDLTGPLWGDGSPRFPERTGHLGSARHPDEVARDLLGLTRHTSTHLLHSTSWRHERADHLVLTYACCPDPRPDLPARPLRDRVLAHGAGPASPSPDAPRTDQVAAHAVRHLAFLLHTDPTVRQVIESVPGLAAILDTWSPAPAGQLPAE